MMDIVRVGGRYRMHQQVGFGSFGESEAVVLHLFMFDSQVRRENIPSVRHFFGTKCFHKARANERRPS
jgi:hypothetical protein